MKSIHGLWSLCSVWPTWLIAGHLPGRIVMGRGKKHGANTPGKPVPGQRQPHRTTSRLRKDSDSQALRWQAEIERQLKARDAKEVKKVREAIDSIEGQEEELAEKRKFAGF